MFRRFCVNGKPECVRSGPVTAVARSSSSTAFLVYKLLNHSQITVRIFEKLACARNIDNGLDNFFAMAVGGALFSGGGMRASGPKALVSFKVY